MMRNQKRFNKRREKAEFDQKLLDLARVTRVVKGGRRFRFRATVVAGNRRGKVGVGIAKGSDVSDAIQKAYNDALKNMIEVKLDGKTIPYDVLVKSGSAKVLLKPAVEGRGIIAGGSVRAVIDLAGIKDIVSKSLGCSNKINVARATVEALKMFSRSKKIRIVKNLRKEEKSENMRNKNGEKEGKTAISEEKKTRLKKAVSPKV